MKFSRRIVIIGCGSVAQCALPLLLELVDIAPSSITIIDFTDQRSKIQCFLDQGVNYNQIRITKHNYTDVLETHLSTGDMLIDLAWYLDTASLLDWCHYHSILFINTSVELWELQKKVPSCTDPRTLTLYHRQLILKQVTDQWKDKNGPTAIVDHGANPGLISHFVKQALTDIAKQVLSQSIINDSQRKSALEQALKNLDYAKLAYHLHVKTIHVSERDTQLTDKPKKVNEFINTWSIEGLIEESIAPSELGFGTHEFLIPDGTLRHKQGSGNQICLSEKGMNTWVRSWVPSGEIIGMVIRHGEAYSISNYLTVYQGDNLIYRPTVHYAYLPTDATMNSLHEFKMCGYKLQSKQRILSNDIIKGEDELGCLLMGHDLKAWWTGSVLEIEESRKLVPGQNATTVQVAIGVVSAALYAIRHPQLGFCLPDYLNSEEILQIAKPYLGQYISRVVNWSPLDKADAFEVPSIPENEWQFMTFKI
ncbi:unnamed protein product [Didymodactylos carnosus]|uniref:Homospermidine synthase n=1 Tax=Didymodactylos carnosus TaxID=1234261 RepID=A0A815FVV7_9BILA|nr:unnamed protein product [Didymodactylos carnosus]CAF1329354.1 unnamed protein product [Didymodactylos carnosus]CAF3658570.1 unnamed protein product [Didymodactylos carnosus]CAF4181489.1 unnamed protein product [Didymodactylos carnosus]